MPETAFHYGDLNFVIEPDLLKRVDDYEQRFPHERGDQVANLDAALKAKLAPKETE